MTPLGQRNFSALLDTSQNVLRQTRNFSRIQREGYLAQLEVVSKANAYIAVSPPGLSSSKAGAYSVLSPPGLSSSKIIAYAVLAPSTPSAPVPMAPPYRPKVSQTLWAPQQTLRRMRQYTPLLAPASVNASGVVREALVSGLTTAGVGVTGLVREALASGLPPVVISSLVRETLLEFIPGYNNFGVIPVFPPLPQGYPIKVSPVMDTTIGTTKSLQETRVSQQEYPLWDIEILFEELRDQTQNAAPYAPFAGLHQYSQLVQTWLGMYGRTGVFAFDCPWDNSRASQVLGIGDGKTYEFAFVRTWGTGALATTAPVGMVNNLISVTVSGVTVPSTQYYFSRNMLYFIGADGRAYPPANGAEVAATFSYYYLCRFVEDEQDFEEFAKNRWTVPSLKFRAVIWT